MKSLKNTKYFITILILVLLILLAGICFVSLSIFKNSQLASINALATPTTIGNDTFISQSDHNNELISQVNVKKTLVDLGTGTSFNVTSYPNYATFTTANFAITGNSGASLNWADYGTVSNLEGVKFAHSPSCGTSMSYNSTTGILSASTSISEYGHNSSGAVHVYLIY